MSTATRRPMIRGCILVVSFAGTLLLAPQARGQSAPGSLCQLGGAIAYMAHLKVTAHQPIDLIVVNASALYLVECPVSMVGALRTLAPNDTETAYRWREAVQAAARDSSNSELRRLLAVARQRVASVHDSALRAYTAGIFDALDKSPKPNRLTLREAADRIALAMLEEHAKCEADLCGAISDNLVFLLGTYPLAMFKAMRADSSEARSWLRAVPDESFAGTDDNRARLEAARRAVVEKLRNTPPASFARERRECLETLSKIRYRTFR
jgi:hypothetical protein